MTHAKTAPPIAFFVARPESPAHRTPYYSAEAAMLEAVASRENGLIVEDYGPGVSFTLIFDHGAETAIVRHLYHPKILGLYTFKDIAWSPFDYEGTMHRLRTRWETTSGNVRKRALWRMVEGGIREEYREYVARLQQRYDMAVEQLATHAATLRDVSDYEVSVEGPEDPREITGWTGMVLARKIAEAPDPDTLIEAFTEAWAGRRPWE